MQSVNLRVKKLNQDAPTPSYNKENAGIDLTAMSSSLTETYIEYGTGISVAIPEGYVGLLFARSSISKTSLMLCNAVGVIDPSYRGEIKARFKKVGSGAEYITGERVVQLVVIETPKVNIDIVEELEETTRGSGGFGSTGV